MGSTSAVTGPRKIGPRGDVRLPVIDLVGSMINTGCEPPERVMPEAESEAEVALLEVPGPVLRKPPSMRPPMTKALPASGLPPRVLKREAPIKDTVPALTKLPPEEAGQVKPEGRFGSLAQEWMPPRVCTPMMPEPIPVMDDWRIRLPLRVPSRSTTMLPEG